MQNILHINLKQVLNCDILGKTNNEDDMVAEIAIDYVQGIVESSDDTRFKKLP